MQTSLKQAIAQQKNLKYLQEHFRNLDKWLFENLYDHNWKIVYAAVTVTSCSVSDVWEVAPRAAKSERERPGWRLGRCRECERGGSAQSGA